MKGLWVKIRAVMRRFPTRTFITVIHLKPKSLGNSGQNICVIRTILNGSTLLFLGVLGGNVSVLEPPEKKSKNTHVKLQRTVATLRVRVQEGY